MSCNGIGLKYGRVRDFRLSDDFTAKNHDLVHAVLDLKNFMAVNGWNWSAKSLINLTLEQRNAITEALSMLIDILFDMGVEIYNEWECRTHDTKESYREYLFTFNQDMALPGNTERGQRKP